MFIKWCIHSYIFFHFPIFARGNKWIRIHWISSISILLLFYKRSSHIFLEVRALIFLDLYNLAIVFILFIAEPLYFLTIKSTYLSKSNYSAKLNQQHPWNPEHKLLKSSMSYQIVTPKIRAPSFSPTPKLTSVSKYKNTLSIFPRQKFQEDKKGDQ